MGIFVQEKKLSLISQTKRFVGISVPNIRQISINFSDQNKQDTVLRKHLLSSYESPSFFESSEWNRFRFQRCSRVKHGFNFIWSSIDIP